MHRNVRMCQKGSGLPRAVGRGRSHAAARDPAVFAACVGSERIFPFTSRALFASSKNSLSPPNFRDDDGSGGRAAVAPRAPPVLDDVALNPRRIQGRIQRRSLVMSMEMHNDRGMNYYSDSNFEHSSSSNGYYSCAGPSMEPAAAVPYDFRDSSLSVTHKSKERAKSSSSSSSRSSSWNFRNDPELKRKQRVASYKVFTVEGKMKNSVRSSFRWIKNKYLEIRYGWF